MTTNDTIFVNMPVRDLQKSIAFFTSLGYAFNPQMTSEDAACMIIGEKIFAMLLTHERFSDFSPLPPTDTSKSVEALFALSCASREEVDDLVRKAVAAGGTTVDEAADHGFMYDHGFRDLDGHCWGVFWINPAHAQ